MGGPSGTIAQSSLDVTNIRQSRIIQKPSKRAHFPAWTGMGQFWDPQTSALVAECTQKLSQLGIRADFVTDVVSHGRTHGKKRADPAMKVSIKDPPKSGFWVPERFQKCHRTPVSVILCEI